jgi:arginine exporter protein ArgO
MAFETRYDNMVLPVISLWTRKEMRKSAALTLGLAFLLWMGLAQARQNFVSEELENDAIRLEQKIGKNLGVLGTRALPRLRKDAQQARARI